MELFDTLAHALTAYRLVIWPLLGLMALVVVVIRWWEQVEYFFARMTAGFPFFGLIARSARQPQEVDSDASGAGTPWYRTERELCARYYRFYDRANKDAHFFDKCANYLNKVEERGRKPTGVGLWAVSAALVLLEAFIFALVLSPFIATNLSAIQTEYSAIVISLLIGAILVPTTHWMGAEIHKNSLIKKARLWHEQARRGNDAQKLQADASVDLEHTERDDDAPKYLHIINRVHHNARVRPTWWTSAIAVTMISVLAVAAYLVRVSTINEMETNRVNASPFAGASSDSTSPFALPFGLSGSSNAGESVTIGPFTLPGEAAQDSREASERAASETVAERIFAYKLTFAILSVVFVGVQIIGIFIGVRRSYAGTQSKEAARYIAGFSSRKEFATWHKRKRDQVARDADMHLSRLQRGIARHHDLGGSQDPGQRRSFALYVSEEEATNAREEAARVAVASALGAAATPPAAVQPATTAPANAAGENATGATTTRETTSRDTTASPDAPTTADDAQIKQLGDLTGYSVQELNSIANELGVDAAKLVSRQKVQHAIARARQAD